MNKNSRTLKNWFSSIFILFGIISFAIGVILVILGLSLIIFMCIGYLTIFYWPMIIVFIGGILICVGYFIMEKTY